MKEIIKAFLIVSFLGIMIPSDKLIIPNGGLIMILVLQTIEYFPEEGIKTNINLESVMALITSVSLLFVILQRKLFNLIGIALQFVWLGYLFKKNDLNDVYYVVTISIYLLLVFTLIFKLFYNRKTNST